MPDKNYTSPQLEQSFYRFLNRGDWRDNYRTVASDLSSQTQDSSINLGFDYSDDALWDRALQNWRINEATKRAKERLEKEKIPSVATSPYDVTKGWRESTEDSAKLDKYTLEELGYSPEEAQNVYDKTWSNSRKALGVGSAATLGTTALMGISGGAAGPVAADVVNGLFAADAVKNLASNNGIQKTYRLARQGDTWGAIKSGAWDALDLSMLGHTAGITRRVGKSILNGSTFGNAYRSDIAGRLLDSSINKLKFIPGQVKYYGPTMGKTTATKTNPNLVDFDDIIRQPSKDILKKYGFKNKSEMYNSGNQDAIQEYESMLVNKLNGFKQNQYNSGKTLVVSPSAVANPKDINFQYDNVPSIPSKETFIERNVGRGGKPKESEWWWNNLMEKNPDLKIDNRFVSEIEGNKVVSAPESTPNYTEMGAYPHPYAESLKNWSPILEKPTGLKKVQAEIMSLDGVTLDTSNPNIRKQLVTKFLERYPNENITISPETTENILGDKFYVEGTIKAGKDIDLHKNLLRDRMSNYENSLGDGWQDTYTYFRTPDGSSMMSGKTAMKKAGTFPLKLVIPENKSNSSLGGMVVHSLAGDQIYASVNPYRQKPIRYTVLHESVAHPTEDLAFQLRNKITKEPVKESYLKISRPTDLFTSDQIANNFTHSSSLSPNEARAVNQEMIKRINELIASKSGKTLTEVYNDKSLLDAWVDANLSTPEELSRFLDSMNNGYLKDYSNLLKVGDSVQKEAYANRIRNGIKKLPMIGGLTFGLTQIPQNK